MGVLDLRGVAVGLMALRPQALPIAQQIALVVDAFVDRRDLVAALRGAD
jgi:hypothetical protein